MFVYCQRAACSIHDSWNVADFGPFDDQLRHTGRLNCPVPCDHVPVRSWPLFRAREVLREVMASLKQEQQS